MEKTMIETLERICETVDSISLNDPRAWESICRDLSGVEKRAQDQNRMPLLAEVCRRTAAIFARVGDKTAENPLAAVDAAVQALSLAASYLQSGAEDDAPLTEALALLEGVSGGTDAEGPADAPTLDEAAALMIQIEPGDQEGQRALKERLDRIAAGADVEQSIREPIEEAADRMAGIVSGTDPDPAAGLDQVGRLIEAAVKAKELAAAGGGADPASAAAPSASAPDGNDYMPDPHTTGQAESGDRRRRYSSSC
jgi:hypothetical protein